MLAGTTWVLRKHHSARIAMSDSNRNSQPSTKQWEDWGIDVFGRRNKKWKSSSFVILCVIVSLCHCFWSLHKVFVDADRNLRNRWIIHPNYKQVCRNSKNMWEIGQFYDITSRYSLLSAPNGHSYPVSGIGRKDKLPLCLREHVKVGTDKQRQKTIAVLLQTAINRFGIAKLLLNDSENMLDLTANWRFSVVNVTFPVEKELGSIGYTAQTTDNTIVDSA